MDATRPRERPESRDPLREDIERPRLADRLRLPERDFDGFLLAERDCERGLLAERDFERPRLPD